MESLRNPFWFGGDVGAEGLVDRDTETAQVERTIRDGSKLFLIGPGVLGKVPSFARRQNDLPLKAQS